MHTMTTTDHYLSADKIKIVEQSHSTNDFLRWVVLLPGIRTITFFAESKPGKLTRQSTRADIFRVLGFGSTKSKATQMARL